MPIVRIELWEGRTLEQKRTLAAQITRTVARIAGCDPSVVQVIFQECSVDNWAEGGALEIDRRIRALPD